MPKVLQFGAYILFFWVGENGEPVHVHISKKRPEENATKVWLTSSGVACLLTTKAGFLKTTWLICSS